MMVAIVVAALLAAAPGSPRVTIGSEAFPESWILGDAAASLVRRAGVQAEHRRNLGGTEIVYQALRTGSVDAYPEYTGTVSEVMLHTSGTVSLADMRAALAPQGIGLTDPLGFNDSYGIAVSPRV